MKIFVKTLKGDRFEIQVKPDDSVADVKKNVETVLGDTEYPSAEQVLIHKGKVLKDETSTVEANNISEKSTIAVMKRKPASDVNYESISESNIQRILEMVRGAWSREMVADALSLAYNDLDKALEYLYFGLPVQSEDPFITEEQTQEPETPAAADLEWSLDSLRHTPDYEYRYLVQSDPSLLQDLLEEIEGAIPPLFQLIQNNKAGFLRLLLEGETRGNEVEQPQELQAEQTNEPNNGGDGGNQVGESEEAQVEAATPEDNELIEQLEALGFERGDAASAYFASNRKVQVAATRLLDDNHKSQDKHH